MLDWARKFFDDPKTLAVIITSSVIGLFIGVAQGIVQRRYGGWGGFAAAIATAMAVSVIAGLSLHGYLQSEGARLAIVGLCALISRDIWVGLETLGRGLRADPLGFIFRVLDAFRGQAQRTNSSNKLDAGDTEGGKL